MATPYLLQGVTQRAAETSILMSSSKYLNHPRLRDWIATITLRKNGPDFPPPAEMHDMPRILDELRDYDHIEAMFTRERRVNPALDRWMTEGFVSTFRIEDFADFAPDSVGGIFYRWITQGNYNIQIVPFKAPQTQLQFFNTRAGQTHDFEHILCGGGFNSLGELVPYWYRMTNVFKHIRDPELAGELCVIQMLGSLRYTVRTMLHYPQIWQATVDAIQRGMRVGQESDALFMARLEDIFHLPLDEARAALGVRGVIDRDTSAEGEIFLDRAGQAACTTS